MTAFRPRSHRLRLLLIACAALAPFASEAATQAIVLKPGWNSVWIDVSPDDPSPAAVFAGLPVEQVWAYFPKDRPVEFIDDPESGLWNKDAWSVYIPSGPEAFLTNLFAVLPHRAYLIKLGGSSDAVLMLDGAVGHRPLEWRPKSYNLVGFPVDPATGGGGVGSFFLNEPALKNGAKYKLNHAGQWVPMLPSDVVRRGQAYWIHADAATSFEGSLKVSGSTDFGAARDRATLEIANTSAWPVTTSVGATGGFPLVRKSFDEIGNVVWTPFVSTETVIQPGETLMLDFGVQRKNVVSTIQEVLTVKGGGTRIDLPLRVETPAAAGAAAGDAVMGDEGPGTGSYVGLWVGSITLNEVAEVNVDSTVAKPTPSEMSFRVILHVDAGGQVKLLKSVTALWKDGVAGGPGVPEVPGRYVLVTDDARIPEFKGATLRDGRPFGYRISSIAYDHPGHAHSVSGGFGGSLSTQLAVAKDSPTHPYRHSFHPDHDGLDPQYQPLPAGITADQEETWAIVRNWQFTFQAETDDHSPAHGYNRASGLFQETLVGMHKVPILMKGSFELQRVAPIAEINPSF